MSFAPDTAFHLCFVPIDDTQTNQLHFVDVAAQSAYFASTAKHSYTGNSYQRKDNRLRIDAEIDTLYDVNYVMYKNTHYTNKWFYAFITRLEYANEGVTFVYFETDVYQTWIFDCTLKDSFVVREMQAVDDIGANLVDEGLNVGDYHCNEIIPFEELTHVTPVVMTTLYKWDAPTRVASVVNGVPALVSFVHFTTMQELTDWISLMEFHRKSSAIIGIILVPLLFIGDFLTGTFTGYNALFQEVTYSYTGSNLFDCSHYTGVYPPNDTSILINTTLDEYSPVNGKMYQFPYNFLHVITNSGEHVDYRWEYFENPLTVNFQIDGGVMPNCVCKLSPMDYKGIAVYVSEALALSGYPIVAYSDNVFANWLAQSAISLPVNFAASGATMIGGAIGGSPMAVGSGALGIAGQIGSYYEHSIEPPQAKGQFEGSANLGMGIHTYHFMKMSIMAERAEMIDNYFSMYGYKQNKVKVPNITSRPCWNYIMTIDVNITGDIPVDDMKKLKNIFNSGLTLWHDATYMGDYSLDNTVPIGG